MRFSRSVTPLLRVLPSGARRELQAVAESATAASAFVSVPRAFVRAAVAPRRRVLCEPESIRHTMLLTKIFAANGYRPVFDPGRPYDVSVHVPTGDDRPTFNGRHQDNQKSRVAEAWARAAGYPLAVDPVAYSGRMVEKSEANATHDGRVVDGPIGADEIQAGKVYQALIDNSDGDEVVDLRVALYSGDVPLVYVKRRPISDRFSNTNSSVAVGDPSDLFSNEELQALSRFAWAVGLDFGEADVLRDNTSGRIYVVDATNGPAGPPNGLPPAAAREAVARLAAAFDAAVGAAVSRGLDWAPPPLERGAPL